MIDIFKTGDLNYADAGLDKPVRYTVDVLKKIASETSTVNITDEHTNKILGSLSNFIVEDGVLKAETPSDFDLKGFGFSPVFDCELIDCGGYYTPSKITFTEIGLTKTPRNQILYNSISTPTNVGSAEVVNMTESALEKVIREKDDLQKRIGVLESSEQQYKDVIKRQKEELNKVKESYSDTEKLLEENKTLKEKANLYDELVISKKEELIDEIAGNDDKLKKKYESFSISDLETVRDTIKVSTPVRGVQPQNIHLDDGNDPSDDSDEDVYTDEMFEADFKASGL